MQKARAVFRRPLSLHKCWPPHTHSDISPQHEQKHLLHNRSNCRYRNRAQIAWPVLGVGPASAIATGEESSLLMRIATLRVSLSVKADSVSRTRSLVADTPKGIVDRTIRGHRRHRVLVAPLAAAEGKVTQTSPGRLLPAQITISLPNSARLLNISS